MFYTIYKTTNNINGKYYIGKHKTQDLDDNYLGSGKILKRAIEKHGIDNFTKAYLFIFDNEEDMNNKENEIVSEEFIKEDTNYNLKIGGEGGWDYINDNNLSYSWNSTTSHYNFALAGRKAHAIKYQSDEEYRNTQLAHLTRARDISQKNNPNGTFFGKKHTNAVKEHIGKINSIKQKGSNNSQYGMMWIYSIEEKISKRIKKDEIIPEGWYKGRKIKF